MLIDPCKVVSLCLAFLPAHLAARPSMVEALVIESAHRDSLASSSLTTQALMLRECSFPTRRASHGNPLVWLVDLLVHRAREAFEAGHYEAAAALLRPLQNDLGIIEGKRQLAPEGWREFHNAGRRLTAIADMAGVTEETILRFLSDDLIAHLTRLTAPWWETIEEDRMKRQLAELNVPGTARLGRRDWQLGPLSLSEKERVSGFSVDDLELKWRISDLRKLLRFLPAPDGERAGRGRILLQGPGAHIHEILLLFAVFPEMESLTIADVHWDNLLAVKKLLDEEQQRSDSPGFNAARIALVHADPGQTQMELGSFDLVYSAFMYDRSVLGLFGNPNLIREWVQELKRILRPTGIYLTLNSDRPFFAEAGFRIRDIHPYMFAATIDPFWRPVGSTPITAAAGYLGLARETVWALQEQDVATVNALIDCVQRNALPANLTTMHRDEIARAVRDYDLMQLSSLPATHGSRFHHAKAIQLLARLGFGSETLAAAVGVGPVILPAADPDLIRWELYLAQMGAHVMIFEPDATWHQDLIWLHAASTRGKLQVFPPEAADFADTNLIDDATLDFVHLPGVLTDPRIDYAVRRKLLLTALQKLKSGGHLLLSGYNNALQSPEAELCFIQTHLKAGAEQGYRFRVFDEGSEPKGVGTHFWICYEVERASEWPTLDSAPKQSGVTTPKPVRVST